MKKTNIHKFNEDFIKIYDEDSNKGFLEVDVEYPKTLHNLLNDLPFLAVGMRIKNCNKLVCNINGKKTWLFI